MEGGGAPGPLWSSVLRPSALLLPQDCQNHCCNATTCQLAKGAECAHGECCHECKVSTGLSRCPTLPPIQLCPKVSGWEGGPRDGGDGTAGLGLVGTCCSHG